MNYALTITNDLFSLSYSINQSDTIGSVKSVCLSKTTFDKLIMKNYELTTMNTSVLVSLSSLITTFKN